MKTKESTLQELAKELGIDVDKARMKRLEGLWKGVEISDEDIEEAKKSLFRKD